VSPKSLPKPPDDLSSLDPPPDTFQLSGNEVLHRIHPKGKRAKYYGVGKEPKYRFDDPLQKFGVLYVANEFQGAFIEVYSDVFIREDKLRLIECNVSN